MIKHGEPEMEATESPKVSKVDAFKTRIIKMFTFEEYGNRKLRRVFTYTIIAILSAIVYFCLSRFTEFYPNAIWLCVAVFTSISTLVAESKYRFMNDTMQLISAITLTISLIGMLIASLVPTHKSTEYYTPTHIYKNEQGTIVTYGTIVLHNNSVAIYNSSNIKLCKTLNSNLWNVRLNDEYEICKEK